MFLFCQYSEGSNGGAKEGGVKEISPKIVEGSLNLPTFIPPFETPELCLVVGATSRMLGSSRMPKLNQT